MKNQLKTVALLGALTGILLWIGSFWGRSGLIFGLVFAGIMNIGSYWFSDKLVLRMYKATEVDQSHDLWKRVKHVVDMAGLPMPKVYIIPSEQPNAFATGRNKKHAAVAFTGGILKLLNKSELDGVIAHELAHIKNKDILITTIAATIAGVISYVSMMARWGAMFGGFGRDNDGGNLAELLVLAIVTPLMAMVIQFSISRAREFIADATGAKILNQTQGLASALQKIENYSKKIPMKLGGQATESMFIINPFSGTRMFKLLSTHPPTEERVKKLREMGF